jgi:hypothetical protein
MRRFLVFAMLAGLPSCILTGATEPAPKAKAAQLLPIKRVILYQNGVGYFEREGKVQGDTLKLHCRPSQINDLLKSLTVIDRGSGRAVSVSLPLEKGGAKALSELPKQVRSAAGLRDVLRVIRGARVRLESGDQKIQGRVVGVEKGLIDKGKGEKSVEGWRLTLKDSLGSLRTVPIHRINKLQLLDGALEAGLDKSLDVSLDEGTWKSIALSVRLAGASTHDLQVSYIAEMPRWKPAYRLVHQSGRPPLLQGWAVVDNVSGESWNDVKLSLVAGTPMSFIYDLHSPMFTQRLDLTSRGRRGVALAPPKTRTGRYRSPAPPPSPKDALQRYISPRRSARGYGRGGGGPSPDMDETSGVSAPSSALNMLLEKKVRTNVQGEKVGSLFRYDLKSPVTVPDSSSTLVNIINSRVKGEGVVLFRPELTSGASHPYQAMRFSNTTGFALEKGPVTIYSEGTFVGEGFLERMEKGATIFLTYAIDGNITMTRRTRYAQENARLLKISGGKIVSEAKQIYREKYKISNEHDKSVIAYIKSAKRSGYELQNKDKGIVEMPNAQYVPIKVPAKGKTELTIEWASPVRRYLSVDTSSATEVLKLYLGSAKVPATVRPALDKILKAKARLNVIAQERRRIKKLKRGLNEDQKRVRDNLSLLRKVKGNSSLKSRLMRTLSSLETKLNKLTGSTIKLDEEGAGLRAEIRVAIGQISLDAR